MIGSWFVWYGTADVFSTQLTLPVGIIVTHKLLCHYKVHAPLRQRTCTHAFIAIGMEKIAAGYYSSLQTIQLTQSKYYWELF